MHTVSLFWDKQIPKKINHLCIRSYLKNNYKVNIFSYLPELFDEYKDDVNVVNANEIINEKEKFYYSGQGDCKFNSIVGFSDLFRYKMLYKVGGWYSDFDVISLKALKHNFLNDDTVIRPHFKYNAISNICKFKQGDSILEKLFFETKQIVDKDNNKWCTPLEIFYKVINVNNYSSFVVSSNYFHNDNPAFLRDLLYKRIDELDLSTFFSIHLCSSFLTSGLWNTDMLYNLDAPHKTTLLHFLYKKYNLL